MNDLYAAMDWVLEPKVRSRKSSRRHFSEGALALYD